jgi:hypothetical protein
VATTTSQNLLKNFKTKNIFKNHLKKKELVEEDTRKNK